MTGVDRDDQIACVRGRMLRFDGLIDNANGAAEIDYEAIAVVRVGRA
jgi:hypothetical protein